jgi:hypothetical protein
LTGYAKRKLIVLLLSVAVIMTAADLYIFKCLSEREAAVQQTVGNKACDQDIRIQAVKQLADFEGLEIAGMEEYTVRIKYCGRVSDANAMFNMLGAEENVIRIGEIIISAVGDENEISADIEYLSNSICK